MAQLDVAEERGQFSMRMIRLVAAGCLILSTGHVRLTASCVPPPPLCETAARADLVFFGEVLAQTTYVQHSERGTSTDGIQAVRFKVTRPFNGVRAGEWWGLFYVGIEAKSFNPGVRYLVFALRRETGAFVTGCTLTREIATRDEEAWSRSEAGELADCFKTRR